MIETKEKEYRMSLTEVNYILMYTDENIIKKIPMKLKKFFEDNEAIDYIPSIDISKPLEEQVLKKYTLSILALIYKDYICNSEQKIEYEKILKENQICFEKELAEKYSYENIFKNNKMNVEEKDVSENMLIVYEKEKFLIKLKNKILSLFKRKE